MSRRRAARVAARALLLASIASCDGGAPPREGDAGPGGAAGDGQLCEVLTQCGIPCRCEPDALAGGTSGISGVPFVDLYFRTVLDADLAARAATFAVEAQLEALGAALEIAGEDDLAAALSAAIETHLEDGLAITAEAVRCPAAEIDPEPIEACPLEHAACTVVVPARTALQAECVPPAVQFAPSAPRASGDVDAHEAFAGRLEAAQQLVPALLAATARAEHVAQTAAELGAAAAEAGPIERTLELERPDASPIAALGLDCAAGELPNAAQLAEAGRDRLEPALDRARAVASALGVEVEAQE